MIHDTSRGREDYVPELSRRQQLDNPFLEVAEANVVTRRDDTGLIESALSLGTTTPSDLGPNKRTGH